MHVSDSSFHPLPARGSLRRLALYGVLVLGGLAPVAAQPQLFTSVRGYGFAADPAGPITGSGWADDSKRVDWEPQPGTPVGEEPFFAGEAWAQASTAGGAVALRGYTHWRGQGMPSPGQGSQQVGYTVRASYADQWNVQVAGVPVGATLYLRPVVRVEVDLRYPWAPDVGAILLPPNFYPTPSEMPLGRLNVDFNLGGLDGQFGAVAVPEPGGWVQVVNSRDPRGFRFENGRAFDMSLGFSGGFAPRWDAISAALHDPGQPWTANIVFDASHTVAFGGLEIVDAGGRVLADFTVTDSLGAAVVPEPGVWAAFAGAAALAVVVLARRNCWRSTRGGWTRWTSG